MSSRDVVVGVIIAVTPEACSRCSLDTRLSLLSSVVVKDLSWLKTRARVTG